MKVYVSHVYDAAGHLHDYYVHQTIDAAVLLAANDVVAGRFEDLDPKDFEAEVQRVIAAVSIEPGVGRRHVRCDSWLAHVDEMPVLPAVEMPNIHVEAPKVLRWRCPNSQHTEVRETPNPCSPPICCVPESDWVCSLMMVTVEAYAVRASLRST